MKYCASFFETGLSMIRRAIFLDFINLAFKAYFFPRQKKYRQKLSFVKLALRQGVLPFRVASRQIFIDISSLVGSDNQTGIHRLVRSFAACVSRMERYEGYRLSLVYVLSTTKRVGTPFTSSARRVYCSPKATAGRKPAKAALFSSR